MEIFKLLESTMTNVQPGESMKHLRRDQLLDNYEAAAKTLQTLMKAKESEIAHRKDLIKMLDDSKSYHDNRLAQVKQDYQTAKSNIPESLNLKSIQIRTEPNERSTTPPMPPPASVMSRLPPPLPQAPSHSAPPPLPPLSMAPPSYQAPMQPAGGSQMNSSDGLAGDSHDQNRSSLDRRLSEFMKNFPGMAPQASVDQQQAPATTATPKPTPGYYTQQPPLATPMQISAAAPPSMELLRFPPPNMLGQAPPPPMPGQPGFHRPYSMMGIEPNHHQENHDSADMELSDHEDSANNSVPPMIAAALQQGAGGKTSTYADGQHFNNPATLPQSYAPRLNPLPFDPAIMDPGLRGSHSPGGGSTSSRDRHGGSGDRSSSSRQRSSASNHGGSSSKSRYSSSSSTSSQSSSHRDKSRR